MRLDLSLIAALCVVNCGVENGPHRITRQGVEVFVQDNAEPLGLGTIDDAIDRLAEATAAYADTGESIKEFRIIASGKENFECNGEYGWHGCIRPTDREIAFIWDGTTLCDTAFAHEWLHLVQFTRGESLDHVMPYFAEWDEPVSEILGAALEAICGV